VKPKTRPGVVRPFTADELEAIRQETNSAADYADRLTLAINEEDNPHLYALAWNTYYHEKMAELTEALGRRFVGCIEEEE
jgi:hypothetical protein